MNIDYERHVLKWVRDPTAIRALMENYARDRRITGGDKDGFHVLSEDGEKLHRFRGLLTPLAECFWPQLLNPAVVAAATKRVKKLSKQPGPRALKTKPKYQSAQQAVKGRQRGSLVHLQIQQLVTMQTADFMHEHPEGAHPWAVDIPEYLERKKGWRPVCSEKRVFDERLGMATSIDLVYTDYTGMLHFIEVKTGYATAAEWLAETMGPMRGPLAGALKNNTLNRAMLQCIAGAMMAVEGYGIEHEFGCWVLHKSENGITLDGADTEVMTLLIPVLYDTLLRHHLERKARKRKIKKEKKTRRVPKLL